MFHSCHYLLEAIQEESLVYRRLMMLQRVIDFKLQADEIARLGSGLQPIVAHNPSAKPQFGVLAQVVHTEWPQITIFAFILRHCRDDIR